ncbi:MAG: alpha/beta hydrolase-fold protein [Zavarzinella sp.]
MRILALVTLFLVQISLFAQAKKGPIAPPDAAQLAQIAQKTKILRDQIDKLRPTVPEVLLADLEIFAKASEWQTTYKEFLVKDAGKQLLAVLDAGIQRCEEYGKTSSAAWLIPKGEKVARGYTSQIDKSVQPYGVTYPKGYPTAKKEWHVEIFLHGRDGSITETKTLFNHIGNKPAPANQDYIELHIHGRGNNAFRWAGETDVFEAFEHFLATEALSQRRVINRKKTVIKGFSMGGAGTWHLGLHHPSKFCVMQPGAGFTSTHGYIGNLPAELPYPQEETLRIYDAVNYAENVRLIPIVAYSGEIDKQRQAAVNIEEILTKKKIPGMTHLIGPGLEHKFPPEWVAKARTEMAPFISKGRELLPKKVQFVTYTLKYPHAEWITLMRLEKHYQKAQVDAELTENQINVQVQNVAAFMLNFPTKVGVVNLAINGQKLQIEPGLLCFQKTGEKWQQVQKLPTGKRAGLQGPIDDAFTSKFLCVIGTGKPLNETAHRAAMAQLDRFQKEWKKWMRGELPVVKDNELTEKLLEQQPNLILFGDPGSNSWIRKFANPQLQWDEKGIKIAGKSFDSSHLPMMIYPNPETKSSYIVLNSGHTFHEADFKGTNALLYPRLGDYAVFFPKPTANDATGGEVLLNGLMNEQWQIPGK